MYILHVVYIYIYIYIHTYIHIVYSIIYYYPPVWSHRDLSAVIRNRLTVCGEAEKLITYQQP